jgi:hypothetical protein
MAIVFGENFVQENPAPYAEFSDNTCSATLTTEGLITGFAEVARAFEKNGIIDELKKSSLYYRGTKAGGK